MEDGADKVPDDGPPVSESPPEDEKGTRFHDGLDRLDYFVTQRPVYVIAVFVVLTAFFLGGVGQITTETGTDDFTEDTPAFEALEEINDNFESGFGEGSGSTQLIQRGENVLSKQGVLRMLRAQHRMDRNDDLRVESSNSVAQSVAQTIDPGATTLEDQVRVVEGATPSTVREASREVIDRPGIETLLSDDLNENEPYASATIGTVSHSIPTSGADGDVDSDTVRRIQLQSEDVVDSVGGDIVVFGGGILDDEFGAVIGDSLAIVIPVVLVLILLFLAVAYRDVIDLLLGLVALVMTILWTFGFMGWTGIPFDQQLIALPVLLLAVGIDFGIHAVNRYKEERVIGLGIADGMEAATDQLLVAFFIVTGTAVIGFGSNITSDLSPTRNFGILTSVGMVFTFLIFGVFMPSAKVYLDEVRQDSWIPEGPTKPLGGDSSIGDFLAVGNVIAKNAPVVFLVLTVVLTVAAGAYATGVDTSFDDEDFLPPEELPDYIYAFPQSLQPGEYTVTETINFLEDRFETGEDDEITIFIEGPLHQDFALESIERAGQDPPETFIAGDGLAARSQGIIDVIESHAERDDEFAELVERNDESGNGVPDNNVDEVLTALLASESRGQALNYVTEDLRSTRVVYSVESDAEPEEISDRAQEMADGFRLDATATGQIVVLNAVIDIIFESAILALIIALVFTAIFLIAVYHFLEGRASLGFANIFPIAVAVVFLAGTMPALGIPLNALTATILSIAVGLGIAYTVHITHRFIDEYNKNPNVYEAISTTLRGTGGALTGSMLTTAGGTGALALAITPVLGQFGLLMAISVVYSYIASMLVLPSALVLWSRYFG